MMDQKQYVENLRVTATAAIIWSIPALYSLFAEGYMLGQGLKGVPATSVMRVMRFDAIGRFILCPFTTWLYYHVTLRPWNWDVDRRDFIPILLGFLLACIYGKWYPIVHPQPVIQ